MENEKKVGGISVETAQIFPVIKKWLYSDKEIFIREIISNASDACTKLRRLISLGEVHDIDESFRITVKLDAEQKTVTVSDNGIGMTAEEVEKYICSIALSGALDFIEKYEADSADAGIIGHFGLGFYSAFMVCDTVELVSRSYTSEHAVRWVCDDMGAYEMTDGERDSRGTDIIMHINDEGAEYLDSGKLREAIDKYCAFMPVPVFFDDGAVCDCTDEECTHEHGEIQINDTAPLWQKLPSECTEEEYRAFYQKVFFDYREPLFSIHINADYPLNFKGILYFPTPGHEFESLEGQVKLYYNQVFVADNIKEVVPEYLLMLRGVLDCPQLPLNVSRSYLQSDGYVKKVSAHIVKKVADKINGLFNCERERFEKLWGSVKLFCEYASLCDKKFFERVRASLLFELTDGTHKTLSEYLEAAKDIHENTVLYATNKETQAQYISALTKKGALVCVLDKMIDAQFITMLEAEGNGVKFKRVDSDLSDILADGAEGVDDEALTALFREVSGEGELSVKCRAMGEGDAPATLTLDEQARRFEDMMKMYRAAGEDNVPESMQAKPTLIINTNAPVISKIKADAASETSKLIAKQLWSLSLLSHRGLSGAELEAFLSDSYGLLSKI